MTTLKDARTAKNLTQEELARNAGISLRYYNRIEKGESVPSVNVAIQICAALEKTVYDIGEWQPKK
ncbi:DNA-binding helix-turn-helix protein [Ancylostoma duodenale]|uniref:DNA-binding helix-turn-helix protein n=1 Tax=Ancylostoma duodenale TaxID=51022 RepID=A0A0C2G139_9BILA|nr:DNA-binding helix-turn-helix protein [Ancylostoma duodenale]